MGVGARPSRPAPGSRRVHASGGLAVDEAPGGRLSPMERRRERARLSRVIGAYSRLPAERIEACVDALLTGDAT